MNKSEHDPLTPREWEVLALVREGLTNEQIADRLGISRDGAKYHVSEILGKLGLSDRIEAAAWYSRNQAAATSRMAVLAWPLALLSAPPLSLRTSGAFRREHHRRGGNSARRGSCRRIFL